MRVLVACEESQAVCIEFRKLGHEAFSCDLQECSGGYPEWHYQQDVFEVIGIGWDMMIGHPPCTYLTVTANKWLKDQPPLKSGALVGYERRKAKKEAEDFFMALWECGIDKICLENPVGSFNSIIKPTQLIHPYYFGDEARKATCLWLKGLPLLMPEKIVKGRAANIHMMPPGPNRWKERSRTFEGIANAMANQWGRNANFDLFNQIYETTTYRH
jgi:hypothetical protein